MDDKKDLDYYPAILTSHFDRFPFTCCKFIEISLGSFLAQGGVCSELLLESFSKDDSGAEDDVRGLLINVYVTPAGKFPII